MGIRNRVLFVIAGLVLRLALLSPYPHSTFTLTLPRPTSGYRWSGPLFWWPGWWGCCLEGQ
jgi:hypothetical protein